MQIILMVETMLKAKKQPNYTPPVCFITFALRIALTQSRKVHSNICSKIFFFTAAHTKKFQDGSKCKIKLLSSLVNVLPSPRISQNLSSQSETWTSVAELIKVLNT